MRPVVAVPHVLLAAGASTRLGQGRAKQLLRPAGGETLVRRAAEVALAAAGNGEPVVVVLGHRAEECAAELAGLPVGVVVAAGWSAGMGASLKAGLGAALGRVPDAAGILLSLCDQPLVTVAHFQTLRRVPRGGRSTVAAAEYGGGPGVPAVFDRAIFPALWALGDAAGAKGLLLHEEGNGRLVRVPMPEAAFDVDTPADLARWPEVHA